MDADRTAPAVASRPVPATQSVIARAAAYVHLGSMSLLDMADDRVRNKPSIWWLGVVVDRCGGGGLYRTVESEGIRVAGMNKL